MASPTPQFQKFITRVHRRYVLIHIVEHGVVGLAFGAVTGIILTAILIWRDLPTELVAIATPLLGLALGLIRGASSRPKRMEAATTADQQLQLADLLGSALTVSDNADWACIIRSQADAVCRKLSPSDVVLHRFGVRVWGGAGLASALVCALALIPTSPGTSMARQNNEITESGNAELIRSASLPPATAIQADPDSVEHSRYRDQAGDAKSKQPTTPSDGSDGRPSTGKQAAGGIGTASANQSDSTHLKLNTGKNPTMEDGHAPADGSDLESAAGVRANSAGSAIAGNAAERALPPWKSPAWAAQGNQVQSDLRAGHIPDAYRDMLSGYFDAH